MKLLGSYKLSVKKEIVWKALNNPDILKQCIPGCESFDVDSDNVFNVIATNQIGPMNATFSGIVKLSNIIENVSYTLSGEGQSSVGFANGIANVKLLEENNVTIVVQINGKKRGLLLVKKDIGEKEAVLKAKDIENIKKNLSNKKITKNIFVKNKVINFLVS